MRPAAIRDLSQLSTRMNWRQQVNSNGRRVAVNVCWDLADLAQRSVPHISISAVGI